VELNYDNGGCVNASRLQHSCNETSENADDELATRVCEHKSCVTSLTLIRNTRCVSEETVCHFLEKFASRQAEFDVRVRRRIGRRSVAEVV